MTREEYIAAGGTPAATKPNGQRRAPWHDYSQPGIYMLTLSIESRQCVFGSIAGTTHAQKGTPDYPHLQPTPFAQEVLENEIPKITKCYPNVEVWKVVLMPDHLHILVCVREPMPEHKHLGLVISGFKAGCTQAWWRLQESSLGRTLGNSNPLPSLPLPSGSPLPSPVTVPSGSPLPSPVTVPSGSPEGISPSPHRPLLFHKGYHDRIVRNPDTLANVRRYMDENPFRAKLRQEIPHLMQRRLHLWIHDREYAAFGNLFLLKNPEKIQVFFHRKNAQGIPTHLTPEYAKERDRLLCLAEDGAVLVTPGISKGEQGVVSEALNRHLPLIILQKEPISEYWKPSQSRFYACASGQLLIIAPWSLGGTSDYERFHTLNDLARDICLTTDTRIMDVRNL